MDTAVLLAGFTALGALGLASIGIALSAATQVADLRERIARLEPEPKHAAKVPLRPDDRGP